MIETSYRRRLNPLLCTGFLSTLLSSMFKLTLILAVCGISWDYFKDSAFLLMLAGAMVSPFLFFPMLNGYIADHMPKRYVMMLAKFLELLLLIFCAIFLPQLCTVGYGSLLLMVFLFSSIGAVFSPALYANIPELFSESDISSANGAIGSAGFWGILIGTGLAPLIFVVGNGDLRVCMLIQCGISALALVSACSILPVISPIQKAKELSYPFLQTFSRAFHELRTNSGILLAVVGDAFFICIGVSILPLTVLFGRYTLGADSAMDIALIQLAPVLGISIGMLLAGRFSGRKIELGLIPIGALGMAISIPLAVYFPTSFTEVALRIPQSFSPETFDIVFKIYPWTTLFLAFTGLSGALFLLPLRAFLQQRVAPELRGTVIACKNAVAFFFVVIGTALTVLFALGGCQHATEIPKFLRQLGQHMPDFSPETLLVSLGVIIFVVTLLSMWVLPNFTLRFIILTLGNTLYKIRIRGAENIPERGPAMLLSNHVSFIDSVLISACTSRQIRFLLHEDYYAYSFLTLIARLTGFFKVPSSNKAKSMGLMFEEIREHIRKGGIVCVFPEGKISQNGVMSRFKQGYQKMMPDQMNVPIIPVNISFVWGSVFSYYFGNFKFRLPKKLPYFSTVSFGKPLDKAVSPFEIRQRIADLSADSAKDPHPDEITLHYALARQAKKHPFRPLIADYNGAHYSAFQFFVRSVLISRELRKMLPTDTSQYVGVLLPNSTAAVTAIMAVLMADKTPSPLNFSVSQETFLESVHKAEMKCIITSRGFLEKIRITPTPEMVFLEDIAPRIPLWNKLAVMSGFWLLPCREFMNIVSPLSHNDLGSTAALLFSSGSTGIPKGVMLSQHNIASDVYSVMNAVLINAKDVILGNLPLFHSFGLNVCFWVPVVAGCRVIYTPNPLDGAAVCDAITQNKVSLMFSTPSFLQKYMHKAKPGNFDTVRLAVTGAEKLRRDIAEKYKGVLNGKREIVEGYGCTELAPVVTINLTDSAHETGYTCGKPDSIGLPLENISIRILDPLSFEPVPPDTEGLLFVKGPMVMQGYLKDEKLTQKVIRNGFYNTGDIAKMDEDGYVHICGRLSRFSKIAGEMVPHEMVESIISEMCFAVNPSENRVIAVGGMPDPTKGEVLLVLYTDEMPLTPEEIVDQLRERSISNLWIPKVANFYKVEHLPLLGSGKLDLTLLRHIGEQIVEERKAKQG